MQRLLLVCLVLAAPACLRPCRAQAAPAHHMVVAANRLAAEAGMSVLRDGGSAADALVAVQAVLTLTEPQSSGIGGGAIAVYYDAATHRVTSWDGRETAPAAVRPDLFLDRTGLPLAERDAAIGGRAVGVPGTLRLLEALQKRYGRRPWAGLFGEAARLADAGFLVSPRLAGMVADEADVLRRQQAAAAYFLPGGTPVAAGATLINHPLAELFRAIATGGADAVQRGAVAGEIAATVRTDPYPGLLTADDLAAYQPRHRAPLCTIYRAHRVCTAGPPSGGGVTVLQVLGLLSHFDLPALDPSGADVASAIIEAERLADADRDAYLADPDFVPVPVRGLLAPDYLGARAQMIDLDHAMAKPRAGNPSWEPLGSGPVMTPEAAQPEHGTSTIAIVDDAGNAVSMTSTVQDPFGSRLLVHGFILNDELTDFSFAPQQDGRPVANRVEPGKRPRTSMAPVLVFNADGSLAIVAGAVGGKRIPMFVVGTLLRMLDWHLGPQAAVAAPHVGSSDDGAELEAQTPAANLAAPLLDRGQRIDIRPLPSAKAAILVTRDGLLGGADPRAEGVALGE